MTGAGPGLAWDKGGLLRRQNLSGVGGRISVVVINTFNENFEKKIKINVKIHNE